jgi:electron transfer flavoprotein alpha subunit
MASIVAYIELREGAITTPSRFVVFEARRIANAVGATVYGLLTVGPLSHVQIDQLASDISAAGADRILCSSDKAFAGPPLEVTHGGLLAQVADHLRPVLILFPAGGVAAELGPPLAVRLGAAYMPNASIEVDREERIPDPAAQRVVLTRWRAAGDGQRKIDIGDLERPIVASLACGKVPAPLGEPYAEVEMLPYPEAKYPRAQLVALKINTNAALELAPSIVWVEAPMSDSTKEALRTALAPDASLFVAIDPEAPLIDGASPSELFFVSSEPEQENRPFRLLTPQASVSRVSTASELAVALARIRTQTTEVPS